MALQMSLHLHRTIVHFDSSECISRRQTELSEILSSTANFVMKKKNCDCFCQPKKNMERFDLIAADQDFHPPVRSTNLCFLCGGGKLSLMTYLYSRSFVFHRYRRFLSMKSCQVLSGPETVAEVRVTSTCRMGSRRQGPGRRCWELEMVHCLRNTDT